MHNLWLVAKHEYRRTVFRRAFLLLTLAIPLAILALVALVIVVETRGESKLPVGYVDQAAVLDESLQAALPDAGERIPVRAYPDETSARAALEEGAIQAFFVFPPDYLDTFETELYFLEEPPSQDAWGDFKRFVQINLVTSYPQPIADRLLEGPEITVYDVASNREFSDSSAVNIILPFIASFFFFLATMSAGGYMLQVVADEKENRMMEVMLTSVSPGQLIGGKALGLLAAALTQLAIYTLAIVVGFRIASLSMDALQVVQVPWAYLGVMALFFLPAYVLISAVMLAIGAAVTEVQQGQQVSGILNLFFMLPILLLTVIFENPGGPLVVFFTLFPTTAFLTISLRWGLGTVPVWQLALSWVILASTAGLMVWAAGRVFRVGMLRYGQALNLRGAVKALRRAS